MRSITQNIVLDRLQEALASRGVDLRRMAILEIAAETFGFQDGNTFVAAMKEGRFDPPEAEMLGTTWHEGQQLTVMRDPVSTSVYAVDTDALPPATRNVRFGLSPYGGLLRMPDNGDVGIVATHATIPEARAPAQPVYVVEMDGTWTDPRVAPWSRLLSTVDDIKVDCGPVHWVDAFRMADIGGRLHFAITTGEDYDSHEQGVLALRSFVTYVEERRETINRLGGLIGCHDDMTQGRIKLEVMLPIDLAEKVDDIRDWHEAIAIMLGADHEAVMAEFGPQVWVKDNALDTHPEGETGIDVTIDVLLMGSKAARAIEDYRDSSDEFQLAVLAPEWIRGWKGPFTVEVADEIAEYLDDRKFAKENDIWSCDNCGETAQDGSGICISCGDDSKDDDRPEDSVCDTCDETIDYGTGICTGCGRDHSEVAVDDTDAGMLKTVMPNVATQVIRQSDANDPDALE